MSSPSATGARAPVQQYSNTYLWYVVGMLALASTISIIDRQILNVMIGPIKRDLGGLSDLQVSLIMGLAFAFVYNIMSFPAGRLADRANRRNLMIVGIAGWSAATGACGLAGTYFQLFLARMGVGIGEATLGPAANSTLADYFDPRRLPVALAIVAAAPFIGQGLAGVVGGPLIDYLESTPNTQVPVIGEVYSWQMMFLLLAIPGLIVAAMFLTLREPPRTGRSRESVGAVPWIEVWHFVKSRRMFFFLFFVAYLGLSIQGWSLLFWIYEFFLREHGWTKTQTGLIYGPLAMFIGIFGSVYAGYRAGKMMQKGRIDAPLRLVFYGTCILMPTAVVLTLLPNAWAAIALLVPVTFLMAMPSGLSMTIVQSIAPNELRGQMIAFYLVAVNFLSYSFAPSLPPLVDLLLYGEERNLGTSISLLAVINYSMAAICLGLVLKHYRAALEEAKAWTH